MATLGNGGFLPTIKCSNCGVEIEIEKMADHLCGPALGSTISKLPPRSFNDAFSSMKVNQSIPAAFKPKPIPKPIDSNAANIPFLGRPPVPKGMQNQTRAASPAGGRKSPYGNLQRSATVPPRASSPDLPLSQECAFPAFPLPSKSPTTRKLDRSNTDPIGSGRSDKFPRTPEPENSSFSKAVPSTQQPSTTANTHKSSTSGSSNRKFSFSNQRPTVGSISQAPSIPTLSAIDNMSMPPPSIPAARRITHDRTKSVNAANRPLDEIGSVRTHRTTASRSDHTSHIHDLPRSASAQGHRYGRSIHDNVPPVPGMLDVDGNAIPRSASAIGTRERKPYDAPPVPTQLQHYRSDSQNTTCHTPSDSTSSNQSERSQAGTSSSHSSPPASNPSSSPQRHGYQDFGNPYSRMRKSSEAESEKISERQGTKSFSRPSYAQPTPPILSPDTFEQLTAGPWQAELRAKAREPPRPLDLHTEYHVNGPYRDNPPYPPAPESPLDPALKGNRLPLLNTKASHLPHTPSFQDSTRSAIVPASHEKSLYQNNLAPSPLPRNTLKRSATTSKGKCRGCNETITGRSVSSADGRLTGRWHKQCFTCKTCSEPFPTMDFYVFGNDPYCSRHYHQLNKSLCTRCDRGIEGQYVDNDRQKFHPHCFTCSECHLILRDTYFDLNGKIFCERHAFKPDTFPIYGSTGRRYPEKRSTRLMMI